MYKVEFTVEALRRLSREQSIQIAEMVSETVEKISVSVDFSLPDDYVALYIQYRNNHRIYGGMDKEGVLST